MEVIGRRAILIMTLASLAYDWGCGGSDGIRRRTFPDEQAAVEHFRKNQTAFQKLAADWLAAGQDSFCTFGTDNMLWQNETIYKPHRVWTRRVLEKDG